MKQTPKKKSSKKKKTENDGRRGSNPYTVGTTQKKRSKKAETRGFEPARLESRFERSTAVPKAKKRDCSPPPGGQLSKILGR